ncbi:mediator complex subunit [Actinomortierella ambigua]|nr:mediator complex subunit [Actinomortierella ambigua]
MVVDPCKMTQNVQVDDSQALASADIMYLVYTMIPVIIKQLCPKSNEKRYEVVETALRQLSYYNTILNECDEALNGDISPDRSDIWKSIALCCVSKGLARADKLQLSLEDLAALDTAKQPTIADLTAETVEDLIGRTLTDFQRQDEYVDCLIEACKAASSQRDIVMLSKICQTLDDNPLVLDLIHLLRSPAHVLTPLEHFVNNLEHSEGYDIDTCNANLETFGIVLILILTIIQRYELAGHLDSLLEDKQGFCYLWLHRMSSTIPSVSLTSMSLEMQGLMRRWISALYDNMGISDDLIQSSKPQMLLEISPALFEQSLAACQADVIDASTLNGGLDYFLQPCLLFVLIGVVQYLCEQILFSTSTISATDISHRSYHHQRSSSMGLAVSPLVQRSLQGSSGHTNGGAQSQPSAAVTLLLNSLKSLLAAEAFPPRLLRLLRSKILAALEVHGLENDEQVSVIQERIASATMNHYSWSVSDPYEIPKLQQQATFAVEAIVEGGRTNLVKRREKGWPVFGNTNYHIDVDLFRTTLSYVGPAQFITTILKKVLKAALTRNGERAVELGAAMMTTPLIAGGDQHLSPHSLMWTLFHQILWIPVPGRLETFSQGKLMARFVELTLALFQVHDDDYYYYHHHQHNGSLQRLHDNGDDVETEGQDGMDIDERDHQGQHPHQLMPSKGEAGGSSGHCGHDHGRAMRPLRKLVAQHIRALEPLAQDRPGFQGFVQGLSFVSDGL